LPSALLPIFAVIFIADDVPRVPIICRINGRVLISNIELLATLLPGANVNLAKPSRLERIRVMND